MNKLVIFDLMGVLFPENILEKKIGSIVDRKRIISFEDATEFFIHAKFKNNRLMKIISKYLLKIEKLFLKRTIIDPESDEIISYLKNKYKLAIISDLPSNWGDYLINKYDLEESFDPILISGKENASKKDKKIFEILLERTNIDPKNMFIVDDKKINLKNAADFGIKTIWFKTQRDKFKFNPDHTVTSLKELKKIL